MGVELNISYVSVEFEVFGHVQGCGFTKYCRDECVKRRICGWIKNSKRGTIVGKMQGKKEYIDQMLDWLTNTGSPGATIEKCDFTNWTTVLRQDYKDFAIRF
uniref:acylphosphatase n=1 Tax=Nyssomyia neivai TaxID=330878 RepID=A0A1L8DD34_9DIPT